MSRIPPKNWARVRAEWETGNYPSLHDLRDRFLVPQAKMEPGKWPTNYHGVQKLSKKQGWTKGALQQNIDEQMAKFTVELYAKKGLKPETAAEILVETVLSARRAMEALAKRVTELAADDATIDAEKLQALLTLCNRYISDQGNTLKALAEYHRVVGAYAPEKRELTGSIVLKHPAESMPITRIIAVTKERLELAEELAKRTPVE